MSGDDYMRKTRIISAFPACGKTFLTEKGYGGSVILDSDSSSFSWRSGDNGAERDPAFPENYITHIRENIGKADYIFVSSHADVRQALDDSDLSWCCVNPDVTLLEEWVGRCYLRGDNEEFLKVLINNWDKWVHQNLDLSPCGYVRLQSGEYIQDKMHFIENLTYNS
jgi:hypothetical protein